MTATPDSRVLAEILGREDSLFAADMAANGAALAETLGGARLLVIGAGGSIGSSIVRQALAFRPDALHAVDINENTLVELVRDLRSSGQPSPDDFRTFVAELGSPIFERLVAAHGPYDAIFNFAAMKHVRAERDPYSLMRMLDTNVVSLAAFLSGLPAGAATRVFSVSTDKTVRPANLMGASKNMMEQVLWSQAERRHVGSARFANVAFSAGSLLEGFLNRLAAGQPLAGPSDVRRYFISHREAGELCLLAGALGASGEVYFPRLNPDADTLTFQEIAEIILRSRGLAPLYCESEEEARRMVPGEGGRWPCHFAPSDTSGEKPLEEFHRDGDAIDTSRHAAIGVVDGMRGWDRRGLDAALDAVARLRAQPAWSKKDIVAAIRLAVPELAHIETERDLDQKM